MMADVFWSNVDKGQGCWLWAAFRDKNGYGKFRRKLAHRRSWELARGPIPPGICVLHRCDNPPCVNPEHLFLGSNAENMADMVAKGRSPAGARNGAHRYPERLPRGEQHYMAELTEDDVLDIRAVIAMGALRSDVAKAYGLNWTTVNCIAKRTTWRHLP